MTSNKDLEKRFEEHAHDDSRHWVGGTYLVLLIICIVLVSAFVLLLLTWEWKSTITEASPCELGFVEWEETCTAYLPVIEDCSRYNICMVGMTDKCKQDYEDCIKYPKFMCSESIKSCPYSGPGIMVVKE